MTAPLVAVPRLADLRTAVITGTLTAQQRAAVAGILMSVGAMAEADIQQGDHGEPMEAARWRIVRDQCLAYIIAAGATARPSGQPLRQTLQRREYQE